MLRVEGQVSPAGNGSKTVTVYPGDVVGSSCDTTKAALGTATVSAVDGSYSVRNRNVRTNPQNVCVLSSGGGVRSSAVRAG